MTVSLLDMPQGSPEWHDLRRRRYGASELAPVLGVESYQTAAEVWRSKLGRPAEREPDELLKAIGHALEPVALEWARRELGELSMRGAVLAQDRGWLLASLDAAIRGGEPIDAKVRGRGAADWTVYHEGAIPQSTALQLLQQAALVAELTGRWPEAAWVTALLGDAWGHTHHLVRLPLDAERRDLWGDVYRTAPGRWHNRYVVTGEPPPDATMADVAVFVDVARVERREATDEELRLVEAWRAAEAERAERAAEARAAEKRRDDVRAALARSIGREHCISGAVWKARKNLSPILTLEATS